MLKRSDRYASDARVTNRQGFTIVELLIVIVIISILAAITVVTFRGIQNRAMVSAMDSERNQVSKQLELFRAQNGTFPVSISDCPSPSANAMCLQPDADTTYSYFAFNPGVGNRYSSAVHATNPPAYELVIKDSKTFLYYSTAEITSGGNEFTQYADLAPLFDTYGIKKYEISFDIKSANISTNSSVNVYMQNGSGARYTFGMNVPVTTDYQRRTITVTPTGPNTAIAQSIMAFYGTYGTGNRATVKNVRIQPSL